MSRLANDIQRCRDAKCIHRTRCLRWLERDSGGVNTPHMASCQHDDEGEMPYPLLMTDYSQEDAEV